MEKFVSRHYLQSFIIEIVHAHNKGKYRNEHATEIDCYQKARNILRTYTPEGKFPSLKSLQAQKSELLELQKAQSAELDALRKNEKTISIAAQNVRYILEGTVKRVPVAHRKGRQIT